METKICRKCKKEFPKNKKHFFPKTIKQQNKNGLAIYHCFRCYCKSCHGQIVEKKRIEKRCKELNCKTSEYSKEWKKQYGISRVKYKETIGLTQSKRNIIRQKIDKGYVYVSEKQYKKDVALNKSKGKRKHDYGERIPTKKEVIDINNKKKIDLITDAYVVNLMGFKKNQVPKEIIESRRALIMLKRELKKNNVKIR